MKKFLFLRFSSIGDIVLTTPVIRCLRARYPDATIHFLCKTNFAAILQTNPYLDKVYHFQKDYKSILPQLKEEGYTDIIDLHKNLRTFRLRQSLGIKSHSYHKANINKWLMVRFKTSASPLEHIVHRYMGAVKALDVFYDGQGLDYFLPEKESFEAAHFGITVNTPFFSFAIGAAHATKRLPVEKIIAICALLTQKWPYKIILLGGPSEKAIGEEIVNRCSHQVINTCGQISLHQSADAVRQSALVLTHDTGMMHIAAAFQKRIVSIWGNTVPAFGMYPFYKEGVFWNESVEVFGLSCRPCSKIGFEKCPKGHFRCMQEIDIARVDEAVCRLLDKQLP